MEKAEILFFRFSQTCPIMARGLEQPKCSFNVGADKFLSIVDGAVNVALRCKMDDRRRLMELQQIAYQVRIINISARKYVTTVVAKLSQIGRVPGVCELIKVDNPRTFLREPMQYEVGADKTGAARHQNRLL